MPARSRHGCDRRSSGEAPDQWRTKIQEVARALDSVLKIRRERERPLADLIVLQVMPDPGEVDGIGLPLSLAPDARSWFVTAHTELAAKAKRYATVVEAKDSASGFEFLQWIKALAERLPATPMVACGEVDAIGCPPLNPYLTRRCSE